MGSPSSSNGQSQSQSLSKKRKRTNKSEGATPKQSADNNGTNSTTTFNNIKTSLKNKTKRLKKKLKRSKREEPEIVPTDNKFTALEDLSDSDGSLVDFGRQIREPNTVLLDSDDEIEVSRKVKITSISSASIIEPPAKKQRVENELAKNQDFISFDFSSEESEEEQEQDNYNIDGYLSNDDTSLNTTTNKTVKDLYPWVKDHDHSTQKEIADWLTMEIKDFVAYISPSKEEILSRNETVRKLKECIGSLWGECEVHVFGSYATDLYLPGSDIDMVVVSPYKTYDSRSKLYQLSSHLRNSKLAIRMEVIAKAKVPIIKFIEPESNIHIDISFERTNGIDAAKQIRKWLASTPGLREIVLIIKQFLASRRLNNVHVGGLGGYSIICLVYSFLQLHPRIITKSINPLENLGALLIEFFELYGRNFGYDGLAIAVDDVYGCRYLKKSDHPDLQGRSPFTLAIQDPSDPANNISRGSFNLRDIKKSFAGAFDLLSNKCYDLNNASYKQRLGSSILGDVIKYRGKERDFNDERSLVVNEALKAHETEEEDLDETNNDKYYYSDMTIESEDEEEEVQIISTKTIKKNKPTEEYDPEDPALKTGSLVSTNGSKNVAAYMGLTEDESDGSLVEITKSLTQESRTSSESKRNNSIDKSSRREYWLKKGSVL